MRHVSVLVLLLVATIATLSGPLVSAQSSSGFVGVITTIAGTFGLVGDNTNSTPISARSAQLISPTSIAGSGDGSMIFADQTTIRNISNGMTWVTVGKRRTSGFVDGPVATALLGGPAGLRLFNDTLYFCDVPNNAIRIVRDGVVSTIAGSAAGGFVNGQSARFNRPTDLDIGPDGSIYVADNANDAIRRIWPNGTTTTVFSVGSLQPKAVKTSPNTEYLVIGCVIGGTDSVVLYFFGNNTWSTIATSPAATNAIDFDDNGNILFAAYNAFYVLFKSRNWERGTLVSGAGYSDGEYPSTIIAPRFQGIQAFSRIRGTLYAFAEASANFVVRTMTIVPEMTPTSLVVSVSVPNIPTYNATVMATIIGAVYSDFINITKYSYNVSATPTVGTSTASGTNFIFTVPAFLSNYSTRLRINTSSWINTQAITTEYYRNKTLAISFPAAGMPLAPYNPTNSSALRAAQLAALSDLIRMTGYGANGVYSVAQSYNVSENTDEVVFYFSVPGPIYNDTTNSLLQTSSFSATQAYVQAYNSYRPISLTFPNPVAGATNGGLWPVTNATQMRDLALLIIQSLAHLTNTGNSNFGIMNYTLSDDGTTSNGNTFVIPVGGAAGASASYFTVDAATGTISIKGTMCGPIENQTTTDLLQQAYLTAFGGNPAAAANVLSFVTDYNADSTLNLYFDTAVNGLPLDNTTFVASVVAAFSQDIQRYFAASPLSSCCVSVSANYSFLTVASGATTGSSDRLVFSATVPGSYHNASLNAAFTPRTLMSSAVFYRTLTAMANLNAPTPVELAFDLQSGPFSYNGITPDMNFPTDNATAMSTLIVPALVEDIKSMLGGGSTSYVASVGSPAFRIVTSPTRTVYINVTIPQGVYNDTTNANFGAKSAAIASAVSASAPLVATPLVDAAISSAYPRLAAALDAYYATQTVTIYFGPAGNFPLWVDPLVQPTTTSTEAPVPTFIFTGDASNTTTADPSATTGTSTAPPPTTITTTVTTTTAASVDSRMASVYAALLKDVMSVVRGNIIYPTEPNYWNASLIAVSTLRDDASRNYQFISKVITTQIFDNATNTIITSNQTVTYIGLRVRVPGPYYNDTTAANLNASSFSNIKALISETVVQNVTFTPMARWPLTNATRMAQIRQLLILDAMTYFNYTGEYLTLDESIEQPIVVNVSGTLATGSVTWRFKVPVVSYASTVTSGSTPLPSRLPTYSFPRTTAALDDYNNNVVTPWRGMAPEPTFFSDSCGEGCVIGIAIAVAVVLVMIAIVVVVVVSKRKRRADVVSPNFNPVMNGKIDID